MSHALKPQYRFFFQIKQPVTMESPHKRPRYFTPVRMKKQESQFSNFRRFIDQLVFSEINNASDLLLALSAKFGTDFTTIAIQAIKHVPAKFPNRWIYISNIVKVINATCTDVQLNLILKHINTIVNVDIHTGAVPEETLWDATYLNKRTHMAFLVTKVDTCMVKGCGGNLFGSSKDTTDVTVFTLRGPVPYLKATLKCKNCCTRYVHPIHHAPLPFIQMFCWLDVCVFLCFFSICSLMSTISNGSSCHLIWHLDHTVYFLVCTRQICNNGST